RGQDSGARLGGRRERMDGCTDGLMTSAQKLWKLRACPSQGFQLGVKGLKAKAYTFSCLYRFWKPDLQRIIRILLKSIVNNSASKNFMYRTY
ncbi:GD14694, partial [Drosophila simulans]